ncbi:MAG: septum formation inhibitor Maf [Clostridiales bacterium]|nr:septum formation inhibitor Maf [Clostridiales bacterium]
MKNLKLVLASQSPRRREILENAGVQFIIRPVDADETIPQGASPSQAVLLLSERKARAAAKESSADETVLAADTIVALDGKILGKPASPQEAQEMLRMLSGRTHAVYTGVCAMNAERSEKFFCRTEVTFYELSEREISAYVNTSEPLDKAGAYGIQKLGALLVKEINGDYFNVVGLPVSQTVRMLLSFSGGELFEL